MKQIKVAWICHFSNPAVRDRLPLSELKLKNAVRRTLGKKSKVYQDFSPWVTNLIKEFELYDDIELHVISPHKGLTRFMHEFEMNGIQYHFYKPDLPVVHVNIPHKYCPGGEPKFLLNRYHVKKFVNKIQPEIVNLIGTENPYYSITSLDINNLPIYVSVQTVYSNPDFKEHLHDYSMLRMNIERRVHKKEKYYGCTGRMHRDVILKNNPDALIFKFFFPIQKPVKVKKVPKIYDFVFFAAGVTSVKGIEDAIDALALVKKNKNDVSLNVVGTCALDYSTYLQKKINDLNLNDNILFNDYFPVHADMYQHIVQSRIAVFPVKLDVIPGALIEAILLGLPVVAYKTTGTPYLNKDGEAVLLADIGDIEMLARHMWKLLNSPSLAEELRQKAKVVVEKEFDNAASAKRLVKNYRAVLNHYHHNTPIPEELLFDVNEFPIY